MTIDTQEHKVIRWMIEATERERAWRDTKQREMVELRAKEIEEYTYGA